MTTPTQSAPPPPPSPQAGGNPMAAIGLGLAVLGLILTLLPFVGLVISVVALILSIVGIKKAGERAGAGKGLGIAGVVVAVLGILIGGMTTACGAACIGMAGEMEEQRTSLDDRARAAGYASFDEWQEAEPTAAAEAAAQAGKDMLKRFGVDVDEEIRKANAAEAAEGGGE